MNHLGLVYLAEGKYAQAEPLFKKTMEQQQRALGPERWQTSAGARNLAHVYLLERHYAESEGLLRQVLNAFESATNNSGKPARGQWLEYVGSAWGLRDVSSAQRRAPGPSLPPVVAEGMPGFARPRPWTSRLPPEPTVR